MTELDSNGLTACLEPRVSDRQIHFNRIQVFLSHSRQKSNKLYQGLKMLSEALNLFLFQEDNHISYELGYKRVRRRRKSYGYDITFIYLNC